MKRTSVIVAILLSVASIAFAQQPTRKPPMVLTTTGFADGTVIPLKYTQVAGDKAVSPDLNWTNVPAGTQSFVLWMHDVDLSLNKTTEDNLHWMIWNIPGNLTSLPEGVPQGADLPDGSHQISYFGPGYRGPGAPATGPLHHYVFELFALDIKVDEKAAGTVPETRAKIFAMMQGHILGKAAYAGLFHRPL